MKPKNLFYITILSLTLSACKFINQPSLLPDVSGMPGDVVVIMGNSPWKYAPGDTLRKFLEAPVEGLPQAEPKFNVLHITAEAFGKIYKLQRNIILTKIGANHPKSEILVQRSLWAKTQVVITMVAPSDTAFANLASKNRNKIVGLLLDVERQRLMNAYASSEDRLITDKIRKEHHISLIVPKGYKLAMDSAHFVWLSSEHTDIIQGILIYDYPYKDKNTFTRDYLVKRRNEFLRKYVHGEVKGSYATTEPLFPPIFSQFKLRNKTYTAELRGLWRMQHGLAMGGPFISISQLDQKRDRVVTVEGFVFAPAHNKRNLLRQVEAIVLSLKIPQ